MLSARSPISLNNVVCNGALSYLLLLSFHVCVESEFVNADHRYVMTQRRRPGEKVTSMAVWRFVGVISALGCNNTHTITTLASPSSAMWSHNAAIHKLMSYRERPCLFGGDSPAFLFLLWKSKYFFCDSVPTLILDTCCSNLLSFAGRAYMLSLQQMSPLGDRSLNRILYQRQSQN